jgi:UDP-N-acetylglucosamine 2-epimerase
MAPVIKDFERFPEKFTVQVAVTGQHREQLDQVLRVFDITPHYDLAIMQHGQSLTQITTRALNGLENIIPQASPDVLLAQGDTTTTFVAALAAFYHQVPFGHVEAGLRTEDIYNPFPEEMNRRLAGVISTFHFAPTEQAKKNLLRENISSERIWVTGNTGIDALLSVAGMQIHAENDELHRILTTNRKLILITAHRRENWGAPLESICSAIAQLSDEFEDCEFVYAMHKNPLVRDIAQRFLGKKSRVHLIEPPDYAPFVKLMQRSFLILTDSGGVQEEAPSFGAPVLVLRNTTERPEGIEAGAAKLVGTEKENILAAARSLLTDETEYRQMSDRTNPYGDGNASERIRIALLEGLQG